MILLFHFGQIDHKRSVDQMSPFGKGDLQDQHGNGHHQVNHVKYIGWQRPVQQSCKMDKNSRKRGKLQENEKHPVSAVGILIGRLAFPDGGTLF